MDAFEKARHVYNRNRDARDRSAARKEDAPIDHVDHEPPKQRATDAVISVTVNLPDKSYYFQLTKQAVYSNAIPTKLTQVGFMNGIRDGLKPLLGELK